MQLLQEHAGTLSFPSPCFLIGLQCLSASVFVYIGDAGLQQTSVKVQLKEVDGVLPRQKFVCLRRLCSHSRYFSLSHPASLCGLVVTDLSIQSKSWNAATPLPASNAETCLMSGFHQSSKPDLQFFPTSRWKQDSKTLHEVLLLLERFPFPLRSWSVAGTSCSNLSPQDNANMFRHWYNSCNGHPASSHILLCYQATLGPREEILCSCAAAEHPWTPRRSESPGAGGKLRQLQCLSLWGFTHSPQLHVYKLILTY